MTPTDLQSLELVWFHELGMPQLLFFSCHYLENYYQLFWNLFLKIADDCLMRHVLKGVTQCLWNRVFYSLGNLSFCFTYVIIITRSFRTCPNINYDMIVFKLSHVFQLLFGYWFVWHHFRLRHYYLALVLTVIFKFQIAEEVNIHDNIQKIILK